MKCQNCETPVLISDEYCEKCGAKLLHRRVFPNAPRREEFTLTPEEPSIEFEKQTEHDDWCFESHPEVETTPQRVESPSEPIGNVRWGGFFRRVGACLIDVVMNILLFALIDRKSTRLNSSHGYISYAVFCLKKKKENE